jgi:hypothetical protein
VGPAGGGVGVNIGLVSAAIEPSLSTSSLASSKTSDSL